MTSPASTSLGAPSLNTRSRSWSLEHAVLLVALVLALSVLVRLLVRGYEYPTSDPHFSVMATAFLHGHLDIPSGLKDTSLFHGRWYVPFGPVPGLLSVPLVVLLGPGTKPIILGVLVTAATVPALWITWRVVGVEGRVARTWLTLLVIGGTEVLSALVVDSTYFVGHLVVFAALSWALALALEGRLPAVAGLMLGLAMATRMPVALAALPLGLLYFRHAGMRATVAFGLPAVAMLGLTGAYNAARFGSPLETGYKYQALPDPALSEAYRAGLLSLRHLPKNLYFFAIAAPDLVGGNDVPILRRPYLRPSPWGTGVIFVSPWLLAGLWARGSRAAILAVGGLLVLAPGLLAVGGGFVQFGYRYSIDALPFFAALAAMGIARRGAYGWLGPLALLALLVNIWGAYWLTHLLVGR